MENIQRATQKYYVNMQKMDKPGGNFHIKQNKPDYKRQIVMFSIISRFKK